LQTTGHVREIKKGKKITSLPQPLANGVLGFLHVSSGYHILPSSLARREPFTRTFLLALVQVFPIVLGFPLLLREYEGSILKISAQFPSVAIQDANLNILRAKLLGMH
jgi:hypothetical protein